MNNRPKIASLSEKELAQLLINLFFIIGRNLKLSAVETKIFLEEVYKRQGGTYTDTFSDAFSCYAALELPEAENLRPQASPRFINQLLKLYNIKCRQEKPATKPGENKSGKLPAEGKYNLFIKFIIVNKSLPGNSDWVTIYEHLTNINNLFLPSGWDTMNYHLKWKHARKAVTEWVYKNFNITETLLYKTNKNAIVKSE
jgi:hypothetical protein